VTKRQVEDYLKDTALCDIMRYSKKNPPKSPFERGTFTAPLSKGGWGDKDVSHNSENCCILNAVAAIEQFTAGIEFDTFSQNLEKVFAVSRAMEIKGNQK